MALVVDEHVEALPQRPLLEALLRRGGVVGHQVVRQPAVALMQRVLVHLEALRDGQQRPLPAPVLLTRVDDVRVGEAVQPDLLRPHADDPLRAGDQHALRAAVAEQVDDDLALAGAHLHVEHRGFERVGVPERLRLVAPRLRLRRHIGQVEAGPDPGDGALPVALLDERGRGGVGVDAVLAQHPGDLERGARGGGQLVGDLRLLPLRGLQPLTDEIACLPRTLEPQKAVRDPHLRASNRLRRGCCGGGGRPGGVAGRRELVVVDAVPGQLLAVAGEHPVQTQAAAAVELRADADAGGAWRARSRRRRAGTPSHGRGCGRPVRA